MRTTWKFFVKTRLIQNSQFSETYNNEDNGQIMRARVVFLINSFQKIFSTVETNNTALLVTLNDFSTSVTFDRNLQLFYKAE